LYAELKKLGLIDKEIAAMAWKHYGHSTRRIGEYMRLTHTQVIRLLRAADRKLTGIDPAGGHFSNSIGPLGTLGLITRTGGVVFPTELLFPESLR